MTNIPEDKMLDINEESSAQLAHPVLCPKKDICTQLCAAETSMNLFILSESASRSY